MVIHGHIKNGTIVPEAGISLPDGTEVTIVVREPAPAGGDGMSPEQRGKYLAALASIDAVPNENPGDHFRGADHDRALYQ
jgi:hypothetical protein